MTGATWKLRWLYLTAAFRPRSVAVDGPAPIARRKDRRIPLPAADNTYWTARSPATRTGEVVVLCGPGPEVLIVPSSIDTSASSSSPVDAEVVGTSPRTAQVRAQPVEARLVVPEADLQMYAAIIGRVPEVELSRPTPQERDEGASLPMPIAFPLAASFVPTVAPHADRVLRNVLSNQQRVKLTSWLRQVSSDARKRIGQARTRLASPRAA